MLDDKIRVEMGARDSRGAEEQQMDTFGTMATLSPISSWMAGNIHKY